MKLLVGIELFSAWDIAIKFWLVFGNRKMIEQAEQKAAQHEQEINQRKKKIDLCDRHIEKLRQQLTEAQKIRSCAIQEVVSNQKIVS